MDLISEIYHRLNEENLMKSGLFDESGNATKEILSLMKSEKDEKNLEAWIENAVINAQSDTVIKAFREGFKTAFRLMREVSE